MTKTETRPKAKSHYEVRALCEGAIFIVIAEVLGWLKIFHMPQGGSISLMMLSMVLYAFRWGLKKGLLAGFVLGVVDFMLGGGIAIGWQSIIGDYLIALTVLGLAGVFHGRKWGLAPAVILGCLGRWVTLWITGAVLWGVYMPDVFLGIPMDNVWFYSVLYNIPIALSGVLTLVVALILYAIPGLRKYLSGADLQR